MASGQTPQQNAMQYQQVQGMNQSSAPSSGYTVNGCWYPGQPQAPAPSMVPSMAGGNGVYMQAFPSYGMAPGYMAGQASPQMMQMQMQYLQYMQMQGMAGQLDPSMMNAMMHPMMNGKLANPPPMDLMSMHGMPAQGMQSPLKGIPAKFVTGTFMESDIINNSETAPSENSGIHEPTSSSSSHDNLQEMLRKLSMSPSQSELSYNSTNACCSEVSSHGSAAEMDASNSLGSGISDPGVLSDNGSNNLETNNSDSSFKNMEKDLKPKPHHKYDKKREHGGDEPVFANRGGMRGQGKKPFTGTRGNHQGGRGGRGGMHAGGRPFPPKSPEEKIAGPREDEGEWKTVERSGPKNRHPRGGISRPPHNRVE